VDGHRGTSFLEAAAICLQTPILVKSETIGGVDLSSKQREVCQGSGFGSEQAQQRERVDCYDGVEQLVNHDVAVGTFMQLLAWASTVLFVPIILPLLLSLLAISGAVIFQWISDGYRNGSPTDSQ
jgi:hypothetical protein